MKVYKVYGQFNDSYAFREYPPLTEHQRIHQELVPDMTGTCRPGHRRCERCGELLNKWDEPLTGLILKKRKYDISYTYDGVLVVSKRFYEVYDAAGLFGLKFQKLPDDPAFYAIRPTRVVPFDAKRAGTRFLDPCPKCGKFESIVGVNQGYLKPGVRIDPNEFVRSDLEFASGDEKDPVIYCGESAARVLKRAKLKGLDLIEVEYDD